MKKLSQILLIAASLLAVAGILQVSAQSGKAATNGNAEVRKWGDWRDGRTKDQAEIRREKLAGKNDGWKTWRDRKAKGKDEIKRERLGGKNDGWRRWRDGETNDGGRAYVGSVNVNTASSAQLRSLPNIGPQTAASIIRNRPYRNIAQFRNANKRFISPLEWRELSRRVRL